MTDCLATLHRVAQEPAAMAAALSELVITWAKRFDAPQAPVVASAEPFRVTGLAAKRLACPNARRVIEKTEIYWSAS